MTGSFITTGSAHASHLVQSFLAKHQITPVTQALYGPDLTPCDFWLCPKLKSPLKGKRFQTTDEIQKNTTGQLMVSGRAVWGPKVPTLKGRGLRHHCHMYSVSCILSLLQYMSLFFISHGWIISGQTLCINLSCCLLDKSSYISNRKLKLKIFKIYLTIIFFKLGSFLVFYVLNEYSTILHPETQASNPFHIAPRVSFLGQS